MSIFPAIGRFTTRQALLALFVRNSQSARKMSSSPLDITATPTAGQNLFHEQTEYTTIREGLAHILIPASASKTPQTTPNGENEVQSVFYNPIQQFNRDLSVLAIKAYGEEVVAKKSRSIGASRVKFLKKKKEKRKREDQGPESDVARKAAKLDVDAVKAVPAETIEKNDLQQEQRPDTELEHAEDVDLAVESETTAQEPIATVLETNTTTEASEKGPEERQEAQNVENQPTSAKLRTPTFTILDALSATGLRAVRYAHEIPFATSITANDLLPEATKTIKMNALHNKLDHKIKAVTGNALSHMYSLVGEANRDDKKRPIPSLKYDVIDLDPYGTAAPFLDAAVQSVRDDGGLLCVTCTDAGVWASNSYPEKCYSLYGGVPAKGLHSHEGGLRLILHAIATSAARYGLAMEPLLSLSIDYYARVFVKIHKSPADVKFLAGKTMMVYNCDVGCGAWTTQMIGRNKLAQNKSKKGYFWKHVFAQAPVVNENCEHCGTKRHLAGPMYAGPLHSADFINKILSDLPKVSKETYQTTTRIEGMLTLALEELLPLPEDPDSPTASSKTGTYDPAEIDHFPFHFIPGVLSKVIHCVTPNENSLKGALRHLGYRVTRSHTKAGSIKTDAPWDVIWDVMREWVKQKSPIKEGAVRIGTPGYKIMGFDKKAESASEIDAGTKPEAENSDAAENGKVVDEPPKKREIVFDESLGKERDVRKLVRYQTNPRENWGPMNRAKAPQVKS